MIKDFLTKSNNPEKSGVIWNMIASMATAFQSVVLLVILSHFTDPVTAGIYTFGNTQNNLFLSVGKYGMRYYQVSDVDKKYKFRDYRMSRIITTIAMALVSTAYVLFIANRNGYSSNKTLCIIWLCLFKLADSFEDVYYGDYQKNERLDIASKCFAMRLIITIIVFAIIIIVTGDLLLATVISTILTLLILFLFIVLTKEYVCENEMCNMRRVVKLLVATTPLMIGSFLTLYIGAAPRNAIDRQLDDTIQAIYGYIAMPVFVVQLLVLFIFNPLIYKLSVMWNEKKVGEFLKASLIQVVFVIIITIVCLAGAWLLGIPVLSLFYNTDLKPYKTDLMLMLVGSGFLGLAGLLANLLTIMRYQVAILIGYVVSSAVAFLFSDYAVRNGGMRGAVYIYLVVLAILCTVFILEFIYGIIRGKNSIATETEEEVESEN